MSARAGASPLARGTGEALEEPQPDLLDKGEELVRGESTEHQLSERRRLMCTHCIPRTRLLAPENMTCLHTGLRLCSRWQPTLEMNDGDMGRACRLIHHRRADIIDAKTTPAFV